MSKSSVNLISALIFLLLTAGGYYYIWSNSSVPSEIDAGSITTSVSDVPDISGLKQQADKLLSGLENNAGLPIPEPRQKMGSSNPFVTP